MVVVSIINFKPLTYDDYIFPLWANWVGWGVALSSMTLVPAYVVYKLLSTPGSLREVSSERALCVCGGGRHGRGHLSHSRWTWTPGSDRPTTGSASLSIPLDLSFHVWNLGIIMQTLKRARQGVKRTSAWEAFVTRSLPSRSTSRGPRAAGAVPAATYVRR